MSRKKCRGGHLFYKKLGEEKDGEWLLPAYLSKAPSGFMQNPFKDSISVLNDPLAYPGKVAGGLAGFYAGAIGGAEFGAEVGFYSGGLMGVFPGALIGGVGGGIGGAFFGKKLGGDLSSWALPKIAEIALDNYTNSIYYRSFYQDGHGLFLLSYYLFSPAVAFWASIHFSKSSRLKRHEPPTLNPGNLSSDTRRYTVFSVNLRNSATSRMVIMSFSIGW